VVVPRGRVRRRVPALVMHVAVCWKWLDDERHAPRGVSAADEAALEIGLRIAGDDGVVSVWCAGPAAAESVLRDAIACGARTAVRLDSTGGAPSRAVAVALATGIDADAGITMVVCGDASADRGSATVPAFVAAELGWPQALGLISVTSQADGTISALRRLDQGRRERLAIVPSAVLSVEGTAARLRRAGLGDVRAARAATIVTMPGPSEPDQPLSTRPFRPRARVVPAPDADDVLARVRQLADRDEPSHAVNAETLAPPAAAARIVERLRAWGYLDEP